MKLYKMLILALLSCIIVISPVLQMAPEVCSSSPVTVLTYLLILICMIKIINVIKENNSYSKAADPLSLPILLFLMLAIMSLAVSVYKHDSLYAFLRLGAYAGLYFMVASEFDHKMRARVIWVAILTGSLLSIYGLFQYSASLAKFIHLSGNFISATYRNHNSFSGLLELIIPVAIALALKIFTGKKRRVSAFGKTGLIAALILLIITFIITQSRGGWISLSISLCVMAVVILRQHSNKIVLLALPVIIALTGILFYFAGDAVSSRISTIKKVVENEDLSMGVRYKKWEGTIGIIKDNPLCGVGIGCFRSAFNRHRPVDFNYIPLYAHNDYLEECAEMGIMAPVIMLCIFCIVITSGFIDTRCNLYTIGCAAGLLCLAIHSLYDYNLHITPNMTLFVVWAAIITGELRDFKK